MVRSNLSEAQLQCEKQAEEAAARDVQNRDLCAERQQLQADLVRQEEMLAESKQQARLSQFDFICLCL